MIGRSVKAKLLVFAIFILGIGGGVLLANFYTTRVASAPAPVAMCGTKAPTAKKRVATMMPTRPLRSSRAMIDQVTASLLAWPLARPTAVDRA